MGRRNRRASSGYVESDTELVGICPNCCSDKLTKYNFCVSAGETETRFSCDRCGHDMLLPLYHKRKHRKGYLPRAVSCR